MASSGSEPRSALIGQSESWRYIILVLTQVIFKKMAYNVIFKILGLREELTWVKTSAENKTSGHQILLNTEDLI